jgi:hypothetical protein
MTTGKRRPSLRDVLAAVQNNGVILEEMRAQNRATIEAVQVNRVVLEEKIDSLARDTGARFDVLEAAVRQNSRDIRKNSDDIRKNSDDIRILTERVDALGPLDQRVSALERRILGEP